MSRSFLSEADHKVFPVKEPWIVLVQVGEAGLEFQIETPKATATSLPANTYGMEKRINIKYPYHYK